MPKRIKNCPVIGCDKSGCRSYDGVPYCGTHGSKAHYNGCHINEDGTLALEYPCKKCGELIVSPKSKVKLCGRCRYTKADFKPYDLTCPHCKKDFTVTSKYTNQRVFCSRKCAQSARWQKRKQRGYDKRCTWCDKEYWTKTSDSITCGDECAYYCRQYTMGNQSALAKPWTPPASKELAPIRQKPAWIRVITALSADDVQHKTIYSCSCLHCGVFYLSYRQIKYCSERCCNKAAKERRRARTRGVKTTESSRWYILIRDKKRCQCCGKQVKYSKNTDPNDDLAFQLDHIVPISKGGSHTLSNLRVTCRKCNMLKSDGSLGDQLLLVG